jgi:hypothetical protein
MECHDTVQALHKSRTADVLRLLHYPCTFTFLRLSKTDIVLNYIW